MPAELLQATFGKKKRDQDLEKAKWHRLQSRDSRLRSEGSSLRKTLLSRHHRRAYVRRRSSAQWRRQLTGKLAPKRANSGLRECKDSLFRFWIPIRVRHRIPYTSRIIRWVRCEGSSFAKLYNPPACSSRLIGVSLQQAGVLWQLSDPTLRKPHRKQINLYQALDKINGNSVKKKPSASRKAMGIEKTI